MERNNMGVHVDLRPKSLANARYEASQKGITVRDLLTMACEELYNGDRSVFMFSPAMPPEMLPKVEMVMSEMMMDKDFFQLVQELVIERKLANEANRIQALKTEDAGGTQETNKSNGGPSLVQ